MKLLELDQEHRDLQQAARKAAMVVEPYAEEADTCLDLHPQTLAALRQSELCRFVIPRAFGGAHAEPNPLAIAVVREQFMYASAHLDSMFALQGLGSYPLSVGGPGALKQAWLPGVATLDYIAALALTEPDVGSDLRAITTQMVDDGREIVISGRKSFITNGDVATFYNVLAREGERYSMVLVPADTPGVRASKGANIIAPHILGEIEFDDVRVPSGNRLGEAGAGFALVLQTLGVFRVTVAAAAVGLGQAAVDEALKHVTTRRQFNKPLLEIGAVSQSIALSWTEVEAARAFAYAAASMAQRDPQGHLDYSSMAKVFATEVAGRVADRSVQVMGRFGLITGSKIERLYRNARPLRVYEGATEVLLDSLARRLAKKERR